MSCKTSEGRRLQSAATKKERKKNAQKTRETAKSMDYEHKMAKTLNSLRPRFQSQSQMNDCDLYIKP